MAFFVWQPGMILTQKCDSDIQKLCLADRPSMAQRPGAVGSCLASIVSTLVLTLSSDSLVHVLSDLTWDSLRLLSDLT